MIMSNPLFIINELSCSYKRGPAVLSIRNLEIPRNKFVVLIGRSGSGKSTLLETLGLMNNTIATGDVIFFPDLEAAPISYTKLWGQNKASELAKVRRESFSFIFQNTNLMPNFTAYENACLSQMIQGKPYLEAVENVRMMMSQLGLSNVPEWKQAVELSGGQRQRLAFVRAITASFKVLFGDEPTGNLDEFNSDDLMMQLNNNLSQNERSVIIVSHNILLSVKYADIIIVLEKPRNSAECVVIENRHMYHKDNSLKRWWNNEGMEIEDIVSTLQSILCIRK